MVLSRSRDRGYRMYPPPPPSSGPPILSSGVAAVAAAPSPAPQHHISMGGSAFQYHQHHHQPLSPRQHNLHQVQASPPYRDVVFHGGGAPVIDLSMAAVYRQRPPTQPPPQPGPGILGPQRIHHLSPGWDDRSFRSHGLLPSPASSSSIFHQGTDSNSVHRLDSSGMVVDRFTPDGRLVSSSYRPQAMAPSSSPHDRSVYWQQHSSNSFFSNEAMVSRGYQQRSPSSPPLVLRPSSDHRFVELEEPRGGVTGGRGHFSLRTTSRMVSPPRAHYDREVRNRSRERSPVRYPRVSRVVGRVSPLPPPPPPPPRHNYEGRHFHREDDEREEGQVTPEELRRKVSSGRNSSSRHHDYDSRQSQRHFQKRDRSTTHKEHDVPVKKTRFDVRPQPAVLPGEASVKKVVATSQKQVQVTRDHPVREPSPHRTSKEKEKDSNQALVNHVVGKASPSRSSTQQASLQVQAQGSEKVTTLDRTKALAEKTAQEQESSSLQPRQAEVLKPSVQEQERKDEDVAPKASSAVENNNVIAPPDSMPASSLGLADETDKASPLELAQKSQHHESQQETEKASALPDASSMQAVVYQPLKITLPPAPEEPKQTTKAVLSIRKNPSMPVAFKARPSATSKTWHRDANALGVSKLSNVFTAGKSSEALSVPSPPAYVRKGNSLVRTSVSKSNGSPLRATVMKKVALRKVHTTTPTLLFSGNPNCQAKASETEKTAPPAPPVEVIDLDPPEVLVGNSGSGAGELYGDLGPDVYVKRKTNQLVRNSPASKNEDSELPPVMRTKLAKALRLKKHWVWTLCGTKKTPHLLPWKKRLHRRVRTRRLEVLPKGKKGSLLSLISEKLRVLRTSQPLYTRSADGFSLHRSGVRGVDGASLKWTKSLESRCRQANQDATKAVAAVEKHCRNKTEKGHSKAGKTRERIVLVGLVRYKMDPSKRTLQRIQECSENANASSSSAGTSALLTPRRASIGGAVYIRMGNGNQLVRDPKASSRALASEKVRWSLHNVRSRVIKKQQYCQFFTRFGKCKKADGKCPYIHDPGKVVVCTKFLKGTCSNVNCLLTHKVIPERMPDCSFFLQGLCINEECPYRHVNVNPEAPVCEGFLKGYCASGDQCNKKHTYVCPTYAATGDCPDISSCKLHHPKKRDQSSKTKLSTSGRRRRYFVGSEVPSSPVLRSAQERIDISDEETETDFISLQGISLDGLEMATDAADCGKHGAREDGLLCFNGMSQEEVERLIKPAFVWQSQQGLVQV